MAKFIEKYLVYSLLWSFAGDASLRAYVVPTVLCCLACLLMVCGMYRKLDMGAFVATAASIPMPDASDASVLDYEVVVSSGAWHPWKARVPIVDVDTHKVYIYYVHAIHTLSGDLIAANAP